MGGGGRGRKGLLEVGEEFEEDGALFVVEDDERESVRK